MTNTTPCTPPGQTLRLRPLASWVRGLALLGGLLIAALPLWIVTEASPESAVLDGLFGGHLMSLLQGELTAAVRWRLAAVTALPAACALYALWQLWRLFGAYQRGDVFGATPLAGMRRFGWGMVGLAVTEPLSTTLASVAISLDNPPGQRQLVVSLGSHDYLLLMTALVFVAVARVMAEAARLAEENEGFV